MTHPLISVIIPCGERHVEHVRTAAASVAWQSLAPLCETIIACDGGADVPELPGCTVLPSDGERRGPAHTRNRAIAAARGRFLIPLDADDYLLKNAVAHLLREYARGRHGYIYGDCYTIEPWHRRDEFAGKDEVQIDDARELIYVRRGAPDYIQGAMRAYNLHVVTGLFPTAAARAVGGYDEGVDAWEDWSFHLRLAIAGVCGHRLPIPIFTYRVYEGDRMTRFYGGHKDLMEAVQVRYRNAQGVIEMAGCCGGDGGLATLAAQAAAQAPASAARSVEGNMIRIEFMGDERGTMTVEPTPGRQIRLGNNARARYANVTPAEHAWIAERLPVRVVPEFDPPDMPEPLAALTPARDTQAIRPARRTTQKLEPIG